MKIEFESNRTIKILHGIFHVIFLLIPVLSLWALFSVAQEYGIEGDSWSQDQWLLWDEPLRWDTPSCNKWYIRNGTKCEYWFEFEDMVYTGVINWDVVEIIFMDRNLWATTNDISNTWSYGYYYQWWNNYGFATAGDTTSTTKVSNINLYSRQNPYYSSTFIRPGSSSWFNWDNRDLWWWSWDVVWNNYDNGEDKIRRQWPCPDGYYIPSLNDVYQLFTLYFNNNWITWYNKFPSKVWTQGPADFTWFDTTLMLAEFKIPVGWFIDWTHSYKRYAWHTWDSNKNTAALWSSTPWNKAWYWYDWEIHTTPINKISIWWWPNYTSYAIPVRCFKEVLDCETGSHQEWWECIYDSMTWHCIQTPWLHNWIYTWTDIVLNLEYTWGSWNTPNCEIICDTWYELTWWNCELIVLDCGSEGHQEWTGCVSNYSMDYCLQTSTIHHWHYTWTENLVLIERVNWSREIPECTMECDEWWVMSWDICVWQPLSITFETYSWTRIPSVENLNVGDDISNLKPATDPKWEGHMFLWWYDENDEKFRFKWTTIYDNITLYAKYAEFEDMVYTWIIDGDVVSITIMDRNFWATMTWAWLSANTASYWYYYQWWNNHWFLPVWENTVASKVNNMSQYWPWNWFYWEDFITVEQTWQQPFNYNLWWWNWDALGNSYDNGNYRYTRQWPCTKWYHVPSLDEWHTLYALYFANNWITDETGFPNTVWSEWGADYFLSKSVINSIMSTFQLPVAWRILAWYSYQRYWSDHSTKNVVHYRSSTPYNDNKNAFGAELQVWNQGTAIANPKINVWWWPAASSAAYPIRCFKNNDDHTITWVDEDWTVLEIDDDVYEWEIPTYYGDIPTKQEDLVYTYEFSGWNINPVAATQDTVYTAVYLSIPKTYTVTWKNYDGTTLEVDENVLAQSIPVYNWSTPIKQPNWDYRYDFIWWTPAVAELSWDTVYTAVFSTVRVSTGLILDETKNYANVTLNWNWWIFSNNSGTRIINYGFYNREEISYSHSSNYTDNWTCNSRVSAWDAGQYLTTIPWAVYLSLYITYDLQEILLWLVDDNKDKLRIYGWTTTGDELIANFNWNGNNWVQGSWNYTITWDSVLIDFFLAHRTISQYESSWFYAIITWTIPVWYKPMDDIEVPSKEGYTFAWWFNQQSWWQEIDFDDITVSGDMEVYAHWTVNAYTATIITSPEWYGIVSSWSIIANYGTRITTSWNLLTIWWTTITATPTGSGAQYTYSFVNWTFSGCGLSWSEEVKTNCTITANFDRELNDYTISFNSSWWTQVPSQTIEYGSTITLPTTTLTWYTFNWWYTQWWLLIWLPGARFRYDITNDLTLYARWTANTWTHYTVRHRLQNINDNLYTENISDREYLTWTTDTQTQAVSKNYSWFTALSFSQSNIEWDESTIIDIYYDREIYTINIDLNWWTWATTLTWKYWQSVSAPEVTKSGYILKKWLPSFPSTMPLYWTSVRAIWELLNADISIQIVTITWENFDLWSIKVSNEQQIITWQLWEDSFKLVDNIGGESWYFVTVSVSSLVWQTNSLNEIVSSNIQIKSQWINTITGTLAEDIWIVSNVTSWTTAETPITYITRPNIVVIWDPMTWTYWDNLKLQITVPAHMLADKYKWVITYTLYD